MVDRLTFGDCNGEGNSKGSEKLNLKRRALRVMAKATGEPFERTGMTQLQPSEFKQMEEKSIVLPERADENDMKRPCPWFQVGMDVIVEWDGW